MAQWWAFHLRSEPLNMIMGRTAVCLLGIVAAVGAFGQSAGSEKAAQSEKLKRGQYLVEKIGMCADCHTPMNEKGEPVMEKHLQGAVLMFKPTVPVPGWAEKSANIAGLKGWNDEEAIKFLTTGVDPNGKSPAPPMPRYRYSKADATAIMTYLRSLGPAQSGGASK
jgi:mono/diheme cytochrome c family protein